MYKQPLKMAASFILDELLLLVSSISQN